MEGLSVRDLMWWMAYNRVDPFGEDRADFRAAMIREPIINAFRGEDDDPVTIADCLPEWDKTMDDVERERRQEVKKKMEAFAQRFSD